MGAMDVHARQEATSGSIEPKNDAKFPGYMPQTTPPNIPMPPKEEKPKPVRFNVRLEAYQRELLDLISWYWNEVDEITEADRSYKWKATSVIEHYVSSQLDAFLEQVGLKKGSSPAQLEERLKKLVSEVTKEQAPRRK
jgi:hypothetical protein